MGQKRVKADWNMFAPMNNVKAKAQGVTRRPNSTLPKIIRPTITRKRSLCVISVNLLDVPLRAVKSGAVASGL
jgi:hypothetical protein